MFVDVDPKQELDMTLDPTAASAAMTSAGLSLAGRRVVVVGGTSGMGRGAVEAAARAGAAVVVAGRRPIEQRAVVESGAGSIEHSVVDSTHEASVKTLYEHVGELDHLFVTAAPEPGSWGPLLDQDLAAARRYLDGKFWASWLNARYAAERMREGGSITFLTGCNVVRPTPGSAIVVASFAALEGMTPALALELGPLRVNTIRPGLVDSEMWDAVPAEAKDDIFSQAIAGFPVRRVGTPSDIGHAALFLMTNSYVTGTVLEVSGGEPLAS
jgi:NAD(P)-dependent dehydrogenase (short-subunit alcohol dehydrogenase family)